MMSSAETSSPAVWRLSTRASTAPSPRCARALGVCGVLVMLGCGPVVPNDASIESSEAPTGVPHADPSSDGTTTGLPPACIPEEMRECSCDAGFGTQTCHPDGEFGRCLCPVETESGGPPTDETGSGTGGSTGGSSTSSGEPQPLNCPDIPQPCSGAVAVPSDPGLEDIATNCTSLDGSLWLSGTVSDISSLGCLTALGELHIESTELTDLSGLVALEQLDLLEIEAAPALRRVGLEQVGRLGRLALTDNPALEQLDFPELTEISGSIQITQNPNLPHCEVQDFVEQLDGPAGSVCYESNGRDACLAVCP